MTRKHCISLLSLLTITLTSMAGGHDTTEIGPAAGKLQPATKKYIQYTETKEGLVTFNALLTRTVQHTSHLGKDAYLVIQTYQNAKGIDIDSSYCAAGTLRPLAYFTDIQSEQHREQVTFTQDSIQNTIIFKDSIGRFTRPNDAFYNGVVTEELIAALPLAEKKRFVLKTVNPGIRFFAYTTTIEVEGKETISLPGAADVSCWRLKVSNGNNFSIEWVTVKGRQQLKKRFVFKNGNTFVRVAVIA